MAYLESGSDKEASQQEGRNRSKFPMERGLGWMRQEPLPKEVSIYDVCKIFWPYGTLSSLSVVIWSSLIVPSFPTGCPRQVEAEVGKQQQN